MEEGPRWTEAKQAHEQRKKNYNKLVKKLKTAKLGQFMGLRYRGSRSVVYIIEAARDRRDAEAIVNRQNASPEGSESTIPNEAPLMEPKTNQYLIPVAQMTPLLPSSGNKRTSDMAGLPALEGKPATAKKRTEVVDLCEED